MNYLPGFLSIVIFFSFTCAQAATLPTQTGITEAMAMAADETSVFIADKASGLLWRFNHDQQDEKPRVIARIPESVNSMGILHGRIYLTTQSELLEVTSGITRCVLSGLLSPCSLAPGPNNTLTFLEQGRNRLLCITEQGMIKAVCPVTVAASCAIQTTADECLLVVSTGVVRYRNGRVVEHLLSTSGESGLLPFPAGLAIVLDTSRDRMHLLGPDGQSNCRQLPAHSSCALCITPKGTVLALSRTGLLHVVQKGEQKNINTGDIGETYFYEYANAYHEKIMFRAIGSSGLPECSTGRNVVCCQLSYTPRKSMAARKQAFPRNSLRV